MVNRSSLQKVFGWLWCGASKDGPASTIFTVKYQDSQRQSTNQKSETCVMSITSGVDSVKIDCLADSCHTLCWAPWKRKTGLCFPKESYPYNTSPQSWLARYRSRAVKTLGKSTTGANCKLVPRVKPHVCNWNWIHHFTLLNEWQATVKKEERLRKGGKENTKLTITGTTLKQTSSPSFLICVFYSCFPITQKVIKTW